MFDSSKKGLHPKIIFFNKLVQLIKYVYTKKDEMNEISTG